jgi:hypothetical protein
MLVAVYVGNNRSVARRFRIVENRDRALRVGGCRVDWLGGYIDTIAAADYTERQSGIDVGSVLALASFHCLQ